MTGADVVCALEAAGYTVTLDTPRRTSSEEKTLPSDVTITVRGKGNPPADLAAALRAHRDECIAYLRGRERQEETLSAFSRMFSSRDPDVGRTVRRFWSEVGRTRHDAPL